ncbi:MAG: YlbF family regulator [Clostridia bacterium]|nr:YlbF family regulator [Clostridia bacterium]
MTNAYDQAHQLARVLAKSPEYVEYKKAKEKLEANGENKKLVADLRAKQMELQKAVILGQKVDEAKKKQLEKMQQIIVTNPAIAEFFQTEFRFNKMMLDVQKIIGEAVGLQFP